MTSHEKKVTDKMYKYGGSFVNALAIAFQRADSDNFKKLKDTFQDYWDKYEKFPEITSNDNINLHVAPDNNNE